MPSSERIYRDSVHNIIRLKTDSAEGQLISRLIDSAEFQRLRRVRQLGLAHFAYQAAEHSRFTHSLGTFHLATRILAKLQTKYEISPDDAVMAAANERRGFTKEEAASLHKLLDTLSMYCAESVVWWDQGQGVPVDGAPGKSHKVEEKDPFKPPQAPRRAPRQKAPASSGPLIATAK